MLHNYSWTHIHLDRRCVRTHWTRHVLDVPVDSVGDSFGYLLSSSFLFLQRRQTLSDFIVLTKGPSSLYIQHVSLLNMCVPNLTTIFLELTSFVRHRLWISGPSHLTRTKAHKLHQSYTTRSDWRSTLRKNVDDWGNVLGRTNVDWVVF